MAEEKQFENKVKGELKRRGAWFFKTWQNGMQRNGIPDIICSYKGRFFGIEVKASKGKPRPLQLVELKNIDKSGGFAILLYPADYGAFISMLNAIDKNQFGQAGSIYSLFKQRWKFYYERTILDDDL